MGKGLHEAFLDELRDCYDAEKQLVKALPKLARAASGEQLRDAFTAHLEETRGHVEKLEQVFAHLAQKPRGKHCDGMAGIVEEGQHIMEEDFDAETMDACLIAAAQRSEHYEIAAYGTLVAWAESMGHGEAVPLLEAILEEEKAADTKLSGIAESGTNQQASRESDDESEQDESDTLGNRVKRMVRAGTPKRTAKRASRAAPAARRSTGGARR
jgi:ferritin-like metal-binding protein YciE